MRKFLKNIAVTCLMAVFGGNSVSHAHLPEYSPSYRPWWVYNTFEKWEVVNDTICGEGAQWNFYFLTGFTVSLNGKEYIPFVSEPQQYHTAKSFGAAPSRTRGSSFTPVLAQGEHYTIGIRRESGKVYANYDEYRHYLNYMHTHEPPYNFLLSFGNPDYFPYRVTDEGEVILYDYTMQEGDVYARVEGYEDILVSAVGEVTIGDGTPRRRLELSNGLVLIEGLGCINSTGMLLDYLNPSKNRKEYVSYLEWYCEKDFELINDFASGIKVKDTYTSGIAASEIDSPSTSGNAFDLQGRRIPEGMKPQRGVYIREGKKYHFNY